MVVLAQGESRTHLRIDAVFVEDGHRKADISDGTFESSEFKEIQDRVGKFSSRTRKRQLSSRSDRKKTRSRQRCSVSARRNRQARSR